MKQIFVRDIEPNLTVVDFFLVAELEIKKKKDGDEYTVLTLADKSGRIPAKYWEDNLAANMKVGDVVKVQACCGVYRDQKELTIAANKIRAAMPGEVDLADFYRASTRDRDEMMLELLDRIASIEDAPLRNLVNACVEDVKELYHEAPAAKTIHHAFIGGLLEHVLSLCWLADTLCPHYKLDRDLVVAAAILHDIGKTEELSYEKEIDYTPLGMLVGHIPLGFALVQKHVVASGIDEERQMLIEHMLLSHHGSRENGSPVVPATREAILFHFLDMVDSRIAIASEALDNSNEPGAVTGFINALGTRLYRGPRADAAGGR